MASKTSKTTRAAPTRTPRRRAPKTATRHHVHVILDDATYRLLEDERAKACSTMYPPPPMAAIIRQKLSRPL